MINAQTIKAATMGVALGASFVALAGALVESLPLVCVAAAFGIVSGVTRVKADSIGARMSQPSLPFADLKKN